MTTRDKPPRPPPTAPNRSNRHLPYSCRKAGHTCDYSIRLNWDGRRTKRTSYDATGDGQLSSPTRGQRPFTIINQTFAANASPQLPPQQRRLSEGSWNDDQLIPNRAPDTGNDTAQQQVPVSPSNHVFPERDSLLLSPVNNASAGNAAQEQEQMLRDMLNPRTQPHKEPPNFNAHQFVVPIPEPAVAGPSPPRDFDNLLFRQPQERAGGILAPLGTPSTLQSAGSIVATPTLGDEGNTPIFMRFHPLANLGPLASPLTPMTPSSYSDDDPRAAQQTPSNPASPDIRRLTVNSLLSGPPGPVYNSTEGHLIRNNAVPGFGPGFEYDFDLFGGARFYGYDLGKRDEDLPKNDDRNAIASTPPTPQTPQDHAHDLLHSAGHGGVDDAFKFETKYSDRPSRKSGGYYKEPVPIRIPHSLEPLPRKSVFTVPRSYLKITGWADNLRLLDCKRIR